MKIIRYLRLFKAFFKYSLARTLEFRGDLLFWTFNNLLWLLMMVAGVNLIFGQVRTIAGWNREEVLLLAFIAALFSDVLWAFFFPNLEIFSRLIRLGELDMVLLKPVNSRFLVSLKYWDFDHYLRILADFYFIFYYAERVGNVNLGNILLFFLLLACGVAIFYSLFFALTVTNIWFVNLVNLIDIFMDIKSLGDRPVYIFKRGRLYLLTFILPVGYVATFPAEALMGQINWLKVILGPLIAVAFFVLSGKFFRFALKHYNSASS